MWARKAGFPGIIGHGLCTLAFVARAVVEGAGGGAPERLKRIAVRFALPVIPGETITTQIWPAPGGDAGEFVFETRAVGPTCDFCWALWRTPRFTWVTTSADAEGREPTTDELVAID